jgi:DNA-binding GntR family transcriptional regulator
VASKKIDPKSFEPSYSQLVHIVQEQISLGELRPGDRLPTEKQLCAYHGISPMTVHRAITKLLNDDVITTQRGKGTFVKPMQFWEASFQLGQLQYLFSENNDTHVKILGLRIIPADSVVADRMKIKTGQKVIFIRRLISSQGKPFLYHREYLLYSPQSPIIESEMEATSLKGLFEGKGNQYFKKSSLTINSINLEVEEAQLLNAPASAAAFRLEHVFYDYDDHPVSWGWFICPGDRMHFSTVTGTGNKEQKNGN